MAVRTKNKVTKKDMRATTFTAILYPENLKPDWEDWISALKYQWVCSPLHDHDVYEDDKEPDKNGNGGHHKGDLKKAHYHIAIYFGPGTKKSKKQVTEMINNALKDDKYIPEPQPSRDMNKLIQYFIHMNDKGKYQYSKDDIRAFNGFDVAKYLNSNSDISSDLRQIFRFAKANKLLDVQILFDRVLEERPELSNTLIKKFYAVNTYIVTLAKKYESNGNKIPRTEEELEPVLAFLKVLKLIIAIKEKEQAEFEKEYRNMILELPEDDPDRIEFEQEQEKINREKVLSESGAKELITGYYKDKKYNKETGEIIKFSQSENDKIINFSSLITNKNKLRSKPNYPWTKP